VEIRPADRIGHPIQARIRREVPAATDELPSMTLSLQGGGKSGWIRASRGRKALEKLSCSTSKFPGEQANYLGGRVYVRFEHEPSPSRISGCARYARTFLKKFNV